jgi:hypothetical protein
MTDKRVYIFEDLLDETVQHFWIPSTECIQQNNDVDDIREPTEEEKLDILEEKMNYREYLYDELRNTQNLKEREIIQKEINELNKKIRDLLIPLHTTKVTRPAAN